MANARIFRVPNIEMDVFVDDESVQPESFYRYFYPHEVDLVLPISCANDMYHIQPSHATKEAFDGPRDMHEFVETKLSGRSSHSEEIPFSDEFLVGSDIDTITKCRLLNSHHSRRKRILLLDLGKYVLSRDDDHETTDWKRSRRLEFIRGYVKDVKRKRFARQYKRYLRVREMLLPSVAAEAAQLRDMEMADNDLDRQFFYSPEEMPDFTELLRIRRQAIARKYEKYAACAPFRRAYHNRIYHNVNAKVPVKEQQHRSAHVRADVDVKDSSRGGQCQEVSTVDGTPAAPRYHRSPRKTRPGAESTGIDDESSVPVVGESGRSKGPAPPPPMRPMSMPQGLSASSKPVVALSKSGLRQTLPGEEALVEEVERLLDAMSEPVFSATGKRDPRNQSMRFNRFMELCETESNYVGILHTILTVFQQPLEAMAGQPGAVLNKAEVRAIFNSFSPIYEAHRHMLDRLTELQSNWSEDGLIGKIITDHRDSLFAAYPPYVNFFDQMRDALVKCASHNPRFQEFLTTNEAKRECRRETLQELMIRPVQRLPSISLLLSDLLKHTPKTSPDYAHLANALEAIKGVMSHINEDKRKMEGLLAMFDIFNQIAGCPADLIASHRRLVSTYDVTELTAHLCGESGTPLVLYLFDDCLEVCKVRKANLMRSKQQLEKKFKHVRLMRLHEIRAVCDMQDEERAFGLEMNNGEVYAFSLGEGTDKAGYMQVFGKLLAAIAGTEDGSKFLRTATLADLGINAKDLTKSKLEQVLRRSGLRV